jgi:hypothetical protein
MPRTFKTASLGYGFGALKNNADALRGFVNSNPELLQQIGGPQALDSYIKQQQQAMFHNPETGGDFQFSPETQNIDKMLQGYQMNSVGFDGMENGRQKAIVKDGETLFKSDPYSYNAAKDNLETVLRGGALIAGTAGLSGLVNGFGGALQNIPAQAGDFGAVAGGGGGSALQGIPAMAGDFGAVAGGGGGIMEGIKTAGGGLLNWAKANPKLAGSITGGLLGGTGGGGGSGGAYTGPMPTISRGDWKPQAQAQMMQVPTFGQGLLNNQGNQGSGLWRYSK